MKTGWLLSGGGLLLSLAGCQSMDPGKFPTLAVVPVESIRHGINSAEANYALGRYYQGQERETLALAAYRRVVEIQPHHAEARNAIGLIYATQGRTDEAIAEFELAVSNAGSRKNLSGPVNFHNNLGYAYLLHGKLAEGIATLTVALQMDPSNQRVKDNLAMATSLHETALATAVAAAAAAATATTVTATAVTATAVTATAVTAAAVTATAAATTATPAPAVTLLLETSRGAGSVAAVKPGASEPIGNAVSAQPSDTRAVRLEISNANGVPHLARDMSRQLAADGYENARLTNVPPYRVPTSQIRYRPGFELQASQLQARLGRNIPLTATATLRADIQVRLLLGKDFNSIAAKSTQAAMPQTLAGG